MSRIINPSILAVWRICRPGDHDFSLNYDIVTAIRVSFPSVCAAILLLFLPKFPCYSQNLIAPSNNLVGETVTRRNIQEKEPDIGYLNFPTKTMGGKQFWTDYRNVGGWKIQRNSVTNHFRLIDSKYIRRAWGNRTHCNKQLDQRIRKGIVRRHQGKVVILLHGLVRTSSSMIPLAKHLKSRGFSPILFTYASSRKSIGDHATALANVIQSLGPDVTEINFVGHSMGNIVVRRYLKDRTNLATGQQGDPRIGKFVMIGPPNQGSKMATIFSHSIAFQSIAGVGGVELGADWPELKKTLAIPNKPFGIIAGGQMNEGDWKNILLNGPDDFTVSLEEAKLEGATEVMVRPLFHSTMMHQKEVLQATENFLKNKSFQAKIAQ